MTRTMKDYSGTNNSNANVTLFHETETTLFQDFLIEKDAKNEAYSFILLNGLYSHFVEFCKNHRLSNPHADCQRFILLSSYMGKEGGTV
ncbi:MAG: hypothetical protein EZS26_000741 [Candidatus Ordinivivax streblomastigis]|uniref:Uncharacterized protein n=1 Tax=Candidatus Ordinivivax streblomastigis TaxID=2540710 RepID=A0A5M8P429_9BACT|nr:MAG: hypothetical protein EZS26_000741 [Candidatus Ordinivivax streblomastigis]